MSHFRTDRPFTLTADAGFSDGPLVTNCYEPNSPRCAQRKQNTIAEARQTPTTPTVTGQTGSRNNTSSAPPETPTTPETIAFSSLASRDPSALFGGEPAVICC